MSNYKILLVSGLISAAALLAPGAPVAAQEDDPSNGEVDIVQAGGSYDGEWSGRWQDGDTWRGMWNGTFTTAEGEVLQGRYVGIFVGEGRFVADDGRVLTLGDAGWHESAKDYELGHHRLRYDDVSASPEGRLGYTLSEREDWLSDCRLLMSGAGGYYDYDDYYRDNADGGLIGGLLGAIGGGIAGNRIADGDRLAGTLIGAGVGGIAGAVIGSLIKGDGDEDGVREAYANELYAARYCEAYLRRYEMGGGAGFHEQMSYGQPSILIQSVATGPRHGQHGHRHGPECTTTLREEWVGVEDFVPAQPDESIQSVE
ncbi:glycine zipper 2TM domain-containing protein [Aurantiacibacter odishensis]|uniref:glycine zipper 2TM domain-containing protein n=1 Tax=Aurantiacibacter odishensis TaxID=1155476 RepID=UPI001F0BEB33|nr:glycine zipper 2TM domain-containing protein [Aurantiacibacter odishensis]